jgi:hypothetical protein
MIINSDTRLYRWWSMSKKHLPEPEIETENPNETEPKMTIEEGKDSLLLALAAAVMTAPHVNPESRGNIQKLLDIVDPVEETEEPMVPASKPLIRKSEKKIK